MAENLPDEREFMHSQIKFLKAFEERIISVLSLGHQFQSKLISLAIIEEIELLTSFLVPLFQNCKLWRESNQQLFVNCKALLLYSLPALFGNSHHDLATSHTERYLHSIFLHVNEHASSAARSNPSALSLKFQVSFTKIFLNTTVSLLNLLTYDKEEDYSVFMLDENVRTTMGGVSEEEIQSQCFEGYVKAIDH